MTPDVRCVRSVGDRVVHDKRSGMANDPWGG
jgi:hypothetical protein